MDTLRVVQELHPLERKILPYLIESSEIQDLVQKSGLQEVEARRAIQWLEAKGLIVSQKQLKNLINLDENGKKYLMAGLPEIIFLNQVKNKSLSIDEMVALKILEKEEVMVSLGLLKSKSAITLIEGKITITPQGKEMIESESPEQKFLKKHFPIEAENISPDEKSALDVLLKRKKILSLDKISGLTFNLTQDGKSLIEYLSSENLVESIESLTPQMLQTGSWKDKQFRRYSINASAPKIIGGRRHPLDIVIEQMRQIWLEMGFQEMEGPWVESAFWCMDSMWIPQDHPARDVQDTFYLPYEGDIPKQTAKRVARAHETGGKSGSIGYGYKWDSELAKKLVLRTHTTATTFRKFADGLESPQKYFCIGRIFRNETVDATHLPEFHQIEGFIMGKGLTLRDLMGYIKEFYRRMGIVRIKFRPTYNPYTEPSMEALGYNEQLGKWIELINSGMFRPEALEPYGIKVPVIAWGLGVERLAMMVYGRSNIREIFGSNSDIDWLRQYSFPKESKRKQINDVNEMK